MLLASVATVIWGSSPRVRGKLMDVRGLTQAARLIPARAGKTSTSPTPRRSRSAHPRACGENSTRWSLDDIDAGSSPRVRGKRPPIRASAHGRRLIPARAGKTSAPWGARGRMWAHPRACGENGFESGLDEVHDGSSPRVRGKPVLRGRVRRRQRLIPARAGKTTASHVTKCATSAHPRACGENMHKNVTNPTFTGSSPRVRGKRCRAPPGMLRGRLIPARAGKTVTLKWRHNPTEAHPRACGENSATP